MGMGKGGKGGKGKGGKFFFKETAVSLAFTLHKTRSLTSLVRCRGPIL